MSDKEQILRPVNDPGCRKLKPLHHIPLTWYV
jgi:hypothetical protein